MFRPCVVIPVYNHGENIAAVVAALVARDLPCYLMDDGSGRACRAVLARLAAAHPGVMLIRHERNRGKGVVVGDGLRAAARAGYSHALQVDADGQHDLAAVPRFLAAARSRPEAVIAGCRPYASMPKGRRYGRAITDFWVWLHTLSPAVRDSMCGYRLYPLAATVALLNRTGIGKRMDFDTDILVRLLWEGVPLEQIEVQVRYPDGVPSHFHMVRDNLRISAMHSRLFVGMLRRLPRLLLRKWERVR